MSLKVEWKTPVSDFRRQNSSWSEREQKKGRRKHGEGNSLLCQEGAEERERENGDGESNLFGFPTPDYMASLTSV